MASNTKARRLTRVNARSGDAAASSPQRGGIGKGKLLGAAAVLAIAATLGVLVATGTLSTPASNLRPLSSSDISRVAYFEFGINADTLYLADPAQPEGRQKLLVLPHAHDFGVVPALAPDGRSFAFTSLQPNLKAPSPETPADLWLAALERNPEPVLLTRAIDLLVPAIWSPDGESLVFRRSRAPTPERPGEFRLFSIDTATTTEQELAYSETTALFPVGFSANSARLYYVELGFDGSRLGAVDVESGVRTSVAVLSDGITRDWALSPAGDKLAYLVMDLTAGVISSRAQVADIASGKVTAAGIEGDAFSPRWTSSGQLVLGTTADVGASGVIAEINAIVLPPPERGFDVPLASSSADGSIAVRAFDGVSAMSPGRSTLAVLSQDGARTTIASGEVTFLGWINP